MKHALVALLVVACASPAPAPHAAPPPPPAPARDAHAADAAPPAIDAAAPAPPTPLDATVALDARAADAAAPLARATIGAHGCPTTFDANALECTRPKQVCHYPQGGCICMDYCAGGAAVRPRAPGEKPPVPRWQCYATPPRTDGCPASFPKGKCTGSLECSYGPLETGLCFGATVRCADGEWMGVQVPPPP